MKKTIAKLFNQKNKNMTIAYMIVIFAFLLVEVLIKTNHLSFLLTGLLVPTVCYIMMALSLNLVVGFSGDLSLGHAAFMCVGAFGGISVANIVYNYVPNTILRIIVCLVFAAIISAIFAYLISIPVFKLTGDYLAIVTLAFCEIVRSLLNNVYLGIDNKGLHFSFINLDFELEKGKMLINGPIGVSGNDKFSSFTLAIVLLLITLYLIFKLINSKYGRAIIASNQNSIAASSLGVDVIKTKTMCFVIASAIAGVAGGLYALNYTSFSPAKFDFNLSIMILVYVVLGGLGNISGTIISTTLLFLLPELLRNDFVSKYRMIIYALIMIVVMLVGNNSYLKNKFDSFKNLFIKIGNNNE